MGPDRFRRIPSAKEFKKIGQHLVLATAVLASSASSSDAQSTPKTQPLSNQYSTSTLELFTPVTEAEVKTTDQKTVELSDIEIQPYVVEVSEILNKDGNNESDNKHTKSFSNESSLSPITGYYCQYIPGYFRGDGGGYCNLTAMGIQVAPGMAACGSNYPLGVYIDIESFGRYLCADRGLLSPNQIDIFFETNEQLEKSQKPDFARVTIVNNP